MKKIVFAIIIFPIMLWLIIQLPAVMYLIFPTMHGTVAGVERMIEQKNYVMAQWSPLTGIWCADWPLWSEFPMDNKTK